MEEEKKIPQVMLTGDRPTGRLHIGHYVGSLRRRVELQNEGKFDEMYIMIADTQALTDNAGNIQKVENNVIEVALDYLSAGIDPSKVTIFVQSRIPELFEFTCYFMDLVTLSRLERNPTVKSELAMRGFGESIPVGFLTYPISQAADILMFGTTIVPVGEDQAPMIEQATEIAHKFNSTYKPVFLEPKIMLPENESARRLPGTDGKAKILITQLTKAITVFKTVEKTIRIIDIGRRPIITPRRRLNRIFHIVASIRNKNLIPIGPFYNHTFLHRAPFTLFNQFIELRLAW